MFGSASTGWTNSLCSVTKIATTKGFSSKLSIHLRVSDLWPVAVFPGSIQVAAQTDCFGDRPAVFTDDQAWLTYSTFILQWEKLGTWLGRHLLVSNLV